MITLAQCSCYFLTLKQNLGAIIGGVEALLPDLSSSPRPVDSQVLKMTEKKLSSKARIKPLPPVIYRYGFPPRIVTTMNIRFGGIFAERVDLVYW